MINYWIKILIGKETKLNDLNKAINKKLLVCCNATDSLKTLQPFLLPISGFFLKLGFQYVHIGELFTVFKKKKINKYIPTYLVHIVYT